MTITFILYRVEEGRTKAIRVDFDLVL